MIEPSRQKAGLSAPSLAPGAPAEEKSFHPRLAEHLAQLSYTDRGTPDLASWEHLITAVSADYARMDQAKKDLENAMKGWSSFENLFRNSPIPIMEQDYTLLEEWMEGLRTQGVTSIREHLGEDVAAIREVAPLIRIVAANPAAVKAVGLPPDRLIGPIDPQIVNEGAVNGWLTQLEAVWDKQPVAHASFTAATAKGKEYDAESILAAPLIAGRPDFSRAVFTLLDVTSHRDEERRMQEVVEAKNEFLASISHEVRTPLTAILGFAHVLEEGDDLAEDDRTAMIHSIVQHAQEVADLVEDLLVAARAEAGQVEVANTSFDLTGEVVRTMRAGGSYTSSVEIRCDEGLPPVSGDPARVRQILRNLLTNAERYGGPSVMVEVTADQGWVQLDVIDDGPGLPDTEWERIFDRYHSAHQSPGRPGAVGIGLTISRQLAELMSGKLDYRHVSGRSVFTLRLRASA